MKCRFCRIKLLAAILTFLLAGCGTLAPRYTRPASPVPVSWPEGSAYQPAAEGTETRSAAEVGWREFFANEKLRKLMELALENNRDLRVSALKIEKARAQYRIQRADLFPTLSIAGKGSVNRTPASLSTTGKRGTFEEYSVGLGMSSYEFDFFGRVRSLKDQTLEEYFATEEARRSAQITLIAEVATAYQTLAADRERLDLARQTLKSHQATYELTRSRFQAGLATKLEVRQAQTSVDSTLVDIARYTSLTAEDENALRFLVGTDFSSALLPAALDEAVTDLKDIPAGVPSEVLQRRPDILAAEHRLMGANANIGAARAAFFPRITLTASGGFASDALSSLFEGATGTWAFAPRIELPIFNAGRLRAQLKTSKVDRDIYLARYEGAIQGAFREVADALAQRGTIDDQLLAQRSLVEATDESYILSEARFRKGIDSFLNVLDSQRSLYDAQQNLITIRLARLDNFVKLYRVLGGGA
ncbi:efflux pump, RND family, outer membrane lipoprotein [Syntrophotalea carbinolica DSM 2380]|uniref:Efflux pump, RND family, outer membrane lipoprotein n=1 Tax=Syntrophotalea carbinolica (strain DSM 2380 / NBRC 103641 / GraBd1) TaxID=338963 RepID=Q3A7U5_SYNC1|nr:efflux transporter outer membrane subunit [Syntrophotalea carbinolica]ABA87549.1 efflux pump, RND family, outer membrane lipoprotein [Syntrophotalea carbinolica DSM 2380]